LKAKDEEIEALTRELEGMKQQHVGVLDMELEPAPTTPVPGASNSGSSQSTVVNKTWINFTGISNPDGPDGDDADDDWPVAEDGDTEFGPVEKSILEDPKGKLGHELARRVLCKLATANSLDGQSILRGLFEGFSVSFESRVTVEAAASALCTEINPNTEGREKRLVLLKMKVNNAIAAERQAARNRRNRKGSVQPVPLKDELTRLGSSLGSTISLGTTRRSKGSQQSNTRRKIN